MQPQNSFDPNQQPQPPVQQSPQVNTAFPSQPYSPQAFVEDPGKTLSLVGLIVAFFIPIVGIPLAAVGRSKSKNAGYSGKLGLAGIFVGIASVILTLVFAIVVPLMLANSIGDSVKDSTGDTLKSSSSGALDDSSAGTTDAPSSSSSSSKPDSVKAGECLQDSGVDPNDLDAYIAASKKCQAEIQ